MTKLLGSYLWAISSLISLLAAISFIIAHYKQKIS